MVVLPVSRHGWVPAEGGTTRGRSKGSDTNGTTEKIYIGRRVRGCTGYGASRSHARTLNVRGASAPNALGRRVAAAFEHASSVVDVKAGVTVDFDGALVGRGLEGRHVADRLFPCAPSDRQPTDVAD